MIADAIRSDPATRSAASAPGTAVRVMICDDSAVIRAALARMLEADPAIRVVARVANGRLAVEALRREPVDVVVLDIEMPVMDGLTALPLLLRADPPPRVIMASTLTTRGAEIALRALRLGAADYVAKPGAAAIADDTFRRDLVAKVKHLARPRGQVLPWQGVAAPGALRPLPVLPPRLVAIGSSTGGPQALFELVRGLGRDVRVPVVLTQHMPAAFTPILAAHLTRLGGMPCEEAADGEVLRPGTLRLAPGDRHLLVETDGPALRLRLSDGPAESFCRPAVDPMLRTAAVSCGGRVLLVMLTGMGHDGLAGTRALVEAGGAAIAQDEATSVVWGMPGAIARAGLCHAVLPLPAIAPRVLDILAARPSSAAAGRTAFVRHPV